MPKDKTNVTIYALVAELESGTAAYIGQAINFPRRMREHLRMRDGKASTLLLRRAEEEGKPVRTIVLEVAATGEDADSAEGAWIWHAKGKGITLISIDAWFQRKNSTQYLAGSKTWPDAESLSRAQLLQEFSKK